jgi:hypothetical protein
MVAMKWCVVPSLIVSVALAGCADSRTSPPATQTTDGGSQSGLLDSVVMKQKPDNAISVRDALKRKDGETVIVTGRTPPGNVKPFNAGVAAFVLMAPEDLAQEDIKEELECEDAATCPSCKKLLDQFAVRVELVDEAGAVIPASAEGFRGLKPGDPVTVEGEVKRDGKENKTVRIVARRFFPG